MEGNRCSVPENTQSTKEPSAFWAYSDIEVANGASGEVVGMDLVEVAPDYDQSGSTAFLAAQLLMNVLGYVFHEKGMSA